MHCAPEKYTIHFFQNVQKSFRVTTFISSFSSVSTLAFPLALQYPRAYIYATLARHFRTCFVRGYMKAMFLQWPLLQVAV